MRPMTKLALTTLAVLALAAGGAGLGVPAGAPVARAWAADPTPEELAAEWDKQHARVRTEAAKAYESLYKWCIEKRLSFTAINARRLVLRYDPENEEVRKFVGYAKTPDGMWIRNEARRDAIREEADIEDPKAQKFPDRLASADKKVIGLWKGLADKAKANADKLDVANADAWKKKAEMAWERMLQVDGGNEAAHKALGHPKFGGKYVRPEAIPYLKVRDERKQGGQKRAAMPFPTQPGDMSPLMTQCGLTGGAAKSEHFIVSTVHGKDVATRVAQWGERTMADFVANYAPPAEIGERMQGVRFSYANQGDREALKKLLLAGGWAPAEVEQKIKHIAGASAGGEAVACASPGADSDDHISHFSAHLLANTLRNMAMGEIGSPNEGIEDWLDESIAYDMTRRLMGTTHWKCIAFGDYGNDIEPSPDKDIWIELAKRLVEYDDDVPLSRLWKLKRKDQQIRGPETVKGYAFLQFVFESDVEKGRAFVRTALVAGTPKAVESVYGVTMDELDAQYREWIMKSW